MSLNSLLTGLSACLITVFSGITVIVNYCRQPDMIEEEALLMAEM
jgi:hypothetical protein